jgi:hypothetical protein
LNSVGKFVEGVSIEGIMSDSGLLHVSPGGSHGEEIHALGLLVWTHQAFNEFLAAKM